MKSNKRKMKSSAEKKMFVRQLRSIWRWPKEKNLIVITTPAMRLKKEKKHENSWTKSSPDEIYGEGVDGEERMRSTFRKKYENKSELCKHIL